MASPIIHTQEELVALAAHYQKLLSLEGWQLKISIVRGHHLFNKLGHKQAMYGANNAQSFISEEQKICIVKVLDPNDYNDDFHDQDMEYSLVHELLHIHFEPFYPPIKNRTKRERVAAECAINMIARALVAQQREIRELRNAR